MPTSEDKCSHKGCGKIAVINYLGKPLCDKHWIKIARKETKHKGGHCG